jgi:putative tryptophan/tyrosine transport system substrate-binding protein
MSYSSNRAGAGRRIGNYTGCILKGAKPGDLPLFQSTKFDLVINIGHGSHHSAWCANAP